MRLIHTGVAALFLGACLTSGPSQALVGESETNGPMAPHAVMVLTSGAKGGGFCTGVVIGRELVLTAAHCVAGLGKTMVFFKQTDAPVFLPPAAIAVHPGYKADAPRTRERSIDLALIRTNAPLPEALTPARLDDRTNIAQGALFGISGFGLTREGQGTSGGVLHWGKLRARAPLSSILLWAEDPRARGFGACEGDSGGPVFNLETNALIAITSWSEGEGKTHCGKLTQAALIAPQRAWIDGVLRGWGVTR
jgi:hypothetical protein